MTLQDVRAGHDLYVVQSLTIQGERPDEKDQTPAIETKKVTIIINEMDAVDFDSKKREWLRHGLANFCGVEASNVRIEDVKKGSTKVTFEIPASSASKVQEALEKGDPELQKLLLGVAGVAPLHQLPSPPELVGRDTELAELEKLLTSTDGGATISGKHAAMQGMGGVGKTALALALAWRLKDRFPDAQLFVNLHGADPQRRPALTPAEALRSVIRAFQPEARLPEEVEALQLLYRSVLQEGNRRCLLLLDDAAGREQVEPLVPPPGCLLLVTSRRQFTLPGLTVRNLDCLAPEKSVELLLKLAPRLDGHAAEAAALCGHLPLALEVFAGAANERKLIPVPELLERLRQKQVKLEQVDAAFAVSCELLDEEPRRRWQLLSVFPASFDLDAAAAVWGARPPSGAGSGASPDTSAAEKVTGPVGGGADRSSRGGCAPQENEDDAREIMQLLVNAGLVEWNEQTGRFRVHDLARDFALEQLRSVPQLSTLSSQPSDQSLLTSAAEEQPAETAAHSPSSIFHLRPEYIARFRHAEHFTRVGNRADQLYLAGGGKMMEGLALFDRERRHLEAAFEFLRGEMERGCVEDQPQHAGTGAASGNVSSAAAGRGRHSRAPSQLVALVNAVAYISDLRFHPREQIRWLEAQAAAAREIGHKEAEGVALGNLGLAYAALGEVRKAIEFNEQVLLIMRAIANRQGEGKALGNLGIAYKKLGEFRKAIEFSEQWLAIARDFGDRRGESNVLGNLGSAYADLGDIRKAIDFCEQQLAIAREIGDRRGEGNALGSLGNACADLGETRKAIEFYEQQLAIVRELGDRQGEGGTLGNLGTIYAALGDANRAIQFHEQALVILREFGDRRAESDIVGNLGNAYAVLGETRKAIEFYEQALVIDREIGDRRGEGADLGNLGNAYAALGETRKAIEFYEQHLAIAREIGDRRGEGNALWNSALALDKLGQRSEAIARAEAALKIREQIEDPNAAMVRAQLAKWRGQ